MVKYIKVATTKDGININYKQKVVTVLSIDQYGNYTCSLMNDGEKETRIFREEEVSDVPFLMDFN